MRAIVFDHFGDESVLHLGDVDPPALGADELRIRVRAAGVNRADLLQRQGHYPPPPGASPILGMECAGEVIEVGSNVAGWTVIGSMGGPGSIDLNVGSLLSKRQQIIGSTLRARPNEEKAAIVASFVARFGDDLRAGRIRPVIDRVFPIAEAGAAHRALKEDHFGKIVLKV